MISLLKNRVQEILKWEKPHALPMRMFKNKEGEYTWEDWHEEMKKKFPYKYFVYETIPDHFSYIFNKIDRKLYWVKSVTYKNQHLLDLRQSEGSAYEYKFGYSDPRQKFIYAVFAILELYVQEHRGIDGLKKRLAWQKTSDEPQEKWIEAYTVFIEIYNWWKEELPIKVKELDRNFSFELENSIEKEINEKIKQLTDYREYLWT
jgi:hypothetical protein